MDNAAGVKFAQYLATKGEKFFAKAGKAGDDLVCDIKSGKVKYWITGPWALETLKKVTLSALPSQ
jgi:hypothetical protein